MSDNETSPSAEYDHPPCCGSGCEGAACWDCRGTGHPHAPAIPAGKTDD